MDETIKAFIYGLETIVLIFLGLALLILIIIAINYLLFSGMQWTC